MATDGVIGWRDAVASTLLHVSLGALYTWGAFWIPLLRKDGWSVTETTLTLELVLLMFGVNGFLFALCIRQLDPHRVALTASLLYGFGLGVAGRAHDLSTTCLAYGVIVGAGVGLGYVLSVMALVRRRPGRRARLIAIVVGGFGAGQLAVAPTAERLIPAMGMAGAFIVVSIIYIAMVGFGAVTVMAARRRGLVQWYGFWLTLFLSGTLGMFGISQASVMPHGLADATRTGSGCDRVAQAPKRR